MRRCLRSQLRALFGIWWMPLLPPVLGLLLGWEASAALGAYARRFGAPEARGALALVLEVRHFFPLAGAAWAAAFLGAEFDARAPAFSLSRGFRRGQVFGSKLLLFFLGCAVCSLSAQLAALSAVPGLRGLTAPYVLRCFLVRLLLDLGTAAPCAAIDAFAGRSLYGRALTGLYGLLLWRLMSSHYGLWLAEAEPPGMLALWPLGALPLSVAVYTLALRRAEF